VSASFSIVSISFMMSSFRASAIRFSLPFLYLGFQSKGF
jgi:hypothetical protein